MSQTPHNLKERLDAFAAAAADRFGLEVRTAGDGEAGSLAFGPQGQRQAASVGSGLDGRASASARSSFDDAAAYGLLVADVVVGDDGAGASGRARVVGTGKAEGRGLSIGLQEFLDPDDADGDPPPGSDDEAFGPGPEDLLPRFAGSLRTGDGADRLVGRSNVRADAGGEELTFVASNGAIVDRDGRLETGGGADVIDASAQLRARGGPVGDNDADGPSAGDADLEVISDGLENVGTIDTGEGDDLVRASARTRSDSGATAIADGIDNSSVGVPDPVGSGGGGVRLLTGGGSDAIEASGRTEARGDGAIANGLDTRSLVDTGSGDDRLTLRAAASFADTADAVGEQEEAIADGLENRGTVILGAGDDRIDAASRAVGNGVLTIADGIDSRGDPGINPADGSRGTSIDAGSGDDVIVATGRARETAPLNGVENGGQKPAKTVASGLLTENAVAGVVAMGTGEDELTLRGVAQGRGSDTAAFGLSNVSFDIPAVDVRAVLDLGAGADRLDAAARATGAGKAAAYGIWGGETFAGTEADVIEAGATARAGRGADARGVNLDDDFTLFGGTTPEDEPIGSDEGAVLDLGPGADVLTGVARARGGAEDGFAAGLFLGEGGVLRGGPGDDLIEGRGRVDGRGEGFGIAGEAAGLLDAGEGCDAVDASAGGFGGGFELRLGAGDDVARGFGDVLVEGGSGHDRAEVGVSVSRFLRSGGAAEESDGALVLSSRLGTMTLRDVEAVDFAGEAVEVGDVVSRLAPSLRVLTRDDGATLTGGEGDDRLVAITATARLEGGGGGDRFDVDLRGRGDVATIADFEPAEDRLIFRGASADLVGRGSPGGVPDGQVGGVDDLRAVVGFLRNDGDDETDATSLGGDLVLSFAGGDGVVLEGLAPLS